MKKKIIIMMTAFGLMLTGGALSAYIGPGFFDDECFFMDCGPESGPCPEMTDDFGLPEIMHRGGFERMEEIILPGAYHSLETADIARSYEIKMEKILADAWEQNMILQEKRRGILAKLKEFAKNFANNKPETKEIVSAIKELNDVHGQSLMIKKEAMRKIQELNDAKEKEIQTANDAWLKKIETDDSEISNYVQSLESMPPRPKPR